MAVFRVQLKPEPAEGVSYEDVLTFCREQQIIGVGWYMVECHSEDYDEFRKEVYEKYAGGERSAMKAIGAIREMRPGDLVWTRIGGNASEYYLCRVGELLWKDRNVTAEHRRHDIGNYVSAKWIHIGKEDKVPGKVVNSFCASATAQHVYDVDLISQMIWNNYSESTDPKYEMPAMQRDEFWNMIGSEELECLIFLYLQSKGYYIYSSTLKLSTATFEAILTHKDGSHLAFPQVKRNVPLYAENYVDALTNDRDVVYLFTTSEDYGANCYPQVKCITKQELWQFLLTHQHILPESIRYWLKLTECGGISEVTV